MREADVRKIERVHDTGDPALHSSSINFGSPASCAVTSSIRFGDGNCLSRTGQVESHAVKLSTIDGTTLNRTIFRMQCTMGR